MKIPAGWTVLTLEQICSGDLQTGPFGSQLHADEYSDEGVPVVMPKDLIAGRIVSATASRIPESRAAQLGRHRILAGDVLFSRRGDVARAGLAVKSDEGSLCGTGCLRARPDKKQALPEFVSLLIQLAKSKQWLQSNAVGQTMPNMNTEILSQLTFIVPSLSQQQRICELVSSWDAAALKTEKLIAANERLLSHQRARLLRAPIQATCLKLHAVTRELTARNGKRLGREAIMAVTKQVGMRPMREETIAANIERYKLVPPKGFAYNPMRLNIGSIAMSPFDTEVLVSPDYVAFVCDESRLLPRYLNHIRHSRHWKSHFETAGNGSVRVRIYYDDLGAFSLELPSVEAQADIVRFLDAAALELDLLRQHADALRLQKRGLMQKLLTGQWRLPLPQAAQQREIA